MFEARFWKYWYDGCEAYETLSFNSVEEILEHVYQVYKNTQCSFSPEFKCIGKPKGLLKHGWVEACRCLSSRGGYDGSYELVRVVYNGNTIIFSGSYISPKMAAACDRFAEEVKQRETMVNGEY